MITYALDAESFYDKECSIKVQGVWGYLRHPACDIYMFSVVGDNGFKWVGHPKDLDWKSISGPGTRWVFHNAQFDMAVIQRLKELNIMPDVDPEQWYCTADLAAYHGLPRSLKGACESALAGLIEVSKDTRNAMNGQRWEDMTPEFQKEVSEYALHDSVCCLMLWQRLSPTWPAVERVISQHTAMISFNGIPVNVEKIDTAIQTLKDQIWEAEGKIPWAGKHPTLSPKQLAEECRKVGIDPPRSLAQDSEECALWEDTYGKQYPWVDAMRTYRRCNALMKKYQSMKIRTRPDNRMDAGLLYCGAHTLRDSGSGGVNLQNMPRDEMFGTNMRECIEAPPGKTFVINDLSQIEPRVLAWLAGDKEFIKLLAAGFGPYEAHARATMGWTGGKLKAENPSMYSLSKARCLALGYGAGWEKFIMMAGNYVSASEFDAIFKVKPSDADRAKFYTYLVSQEKRKVGGVSKFNAASEEDQWVCVNAWLQVTDYRKANTKITDFWETLDQSFKMSAGKDCTIALPNGREMKYRGIEVRGGSVTCVQVRQGAWMRTKLYGGLGAENICQSLARDVFMDCVYRILKAGHKIILRVHDEVVIECDEDKADQVLAEVSEIMHTAPSWISSLPLASEGMITKVYKK